ncbi:hypothetical protein H257_18094 [Aphanomyces astaci]|uniref:Uncharacterized protein n=1 Tax=Aphanomyces astaci TaxID=112090 RepID=W4FE11_APHAT|nr:hypothetical protein H257_18094 [Aphanomyces astaci]ETV65104.1 hypothetical protein H257_18094 [Aphanomyces astaci]|eukprot:XP_009845407.1 hypothetical protein H257_18094 [Aphanomyces astaci]
MTEQHDVQAEGKKEPVHRFTTPQDVDLLKESQRYGLQKALRRPTGSLPEGHLGIIARITDEEYDER